MPDFYSLVNKLNPTANLQAAIIALIDSILQGGHITDVQADALAKLRSQAAILLKSL